MRALLVYNLITFRGRLTRLLVVFAVVLAVNLLLRDIPLGGLAGALLLSVIRAGGNDEAQRRWLLTMPVSRRQLVVCSYITEAALGLVASLLCALLFLLSGETARVTLLACAVICCIFLTVEGIVLCFDFKYGPDLQGGIAAAIVLVVLILELFFVMLLVEAIGANVTWPLLIHPASAAASIAFSLPASIRAVEGRDF